MYIVGLFAPNDDKNKVNNKKKKGDNASKGNK